MEKQDSPLFKPGDRVKIVNYGHKLFGQQGWGFKSLSPGVWDMRPELVGEAGTIECADHHGKDWAIDFDKFGRSAWYSADQMEKIEELKLPVEFTPVLPSAFDRPTIGRFPQDEPGQLQISKRPFLRTGSMSPYYDIGLRKPHEVEGCATCPMLDSEFNRCQDPRNTEHVGDSLIESALKNPELEHPEWCPLTTGSITIKLKRP